jgi:hypothetical protein
LDGRRDDRLGGVVRAGSIEAVGDGAAFDPLDGSWRSIRSSPHGVLGSGGQAAAWTGSELIIVGGTLGDGLARPIAASVNPSTDRWHKLPGFGHLEALRLSSAIWSGDLPEADPTT